MKLFDWSYLRTEGRFYMNFQKEIRYRVFLKNRVAIKVLKTTDFVSFGWNPEKIAYSGIDRKHDHLDLGISSNVQKGENGYAVTCLIKTRSFAMKNTYQMKLRVLIFERFLGAKANEKKLDNETTRLVFQEQEMATDMSLNF